MSQYDAIYISIACTKNKVCVGASTTGGCIKDPKPSLYLSGLGVASARRSGAKRSARTRHNASRSAPSRSTASLFSSLPALACTHRRVISLSICPRKKMKTLCWASDHEVVKKTRKRETWNSPKNRRGRTTKTTMMMSDLCQCQRRRAVTEPQRRNGKVRSCALV